VSTNIAETSLTIDGVVFVIDPGFAKQKVSHNLKSIYGTKSCIQGRKSDVGKMDSVVGFVNWKFTQVPASSGVILCQSTDCN